MPVAAFAVLVAGSDGAALAQEAKGAAGDTAAPAAPVEPATIAVGDVGVESERVKRRLEEGREALAPTTVTEQAAAAIPSLERQVQAQIERSRAVRAGSPSVQALERVRKEWTDLREALRTTQTALRQRGAAIDKQIAAVREARSLWTATRARALDLEVDPEIIGQIDEVLGVIEDVGAEANRRQAEVLGLQSKVAGLTEIVEGDLSRIAEARNQAVGLVLHRDAPPIWSSEFWRSLDASEIGEQLSAQEARETAILADYWRAHRERIFVHFSLTVLLVVIVVGMHRRIDDRLAGEADLAPVRAIFGRPIALALLVSFFAGLVVFSELVRSFEPLFVAATLIPAVVVLRQILDRPLLPLLTLTVSVLFAHYLHEMIAEAVVLSRVIFMGEMAALVVMSARGLQPERLAEVPREMATSPLFRVVGIGLRAVLVLASITLLALAAGFGALANLLGGSLVFSMAGAIVLYGTFRVLDGVIAFLLRVRPLRLLGMVRHHQWLVRRRIRLMLQLGAWFIFVRATLRRLELWDDSTDALTAVLAARLPLPEVGITVGDVVAAGLVFWGALTVSRLIRFGLAEDVFSRVTMPKGRPYAIATLFHYAMLILGLVLAAAALGFDANRATLLTGAFGVGIGFGLQTIVNNFVSGIILLTERPIQLGDTIAMGEIFGEVQRIGIRSSTVRTWQGAEVIVPNADLISQQVTNWTLSDRRRRMEIPVGVAYGSAPQRAIDALLAAVRDVEGILADPAPVVLFMGFGESSLDFEVRAWTEQFDSFFGIRSAICVRIVERLAEAGLEVPFPQRDLHLKSVAAAVGRRASAETEAEQSPAPPPLRPADDDRRAGPD